MFRAYGDESRDRTKARVYAVAGVFGHDGDWHAIEPLWQRHLNGRIFHAADLEAGYGEFAGMDERTRHRLYRQLVKLVAGSRIMGHGIAINIAEYVAAFPHDFEHAPYLWAFGDVVQAMGELAALQIPPGQVQITFDRNQDIEYNACLLYEFMLHSGRMPVAARDCLAEKIAFADRAVVGVQIADLFAREAMRRLDGQLPPKREVSRLSLAALRDTQRFRLETIGAPVFEDKKSKLAAEFHERASMMEYRRWLSENGLHDCLSNRIWHLREFPELR